MQSHPTPGDKAAHSSKAAHAMRILDLMNRMDLEWIYTDPGNHACTQGMYSISELLTCRCKEDYSTDGLYIGKVRAGLPAATTVCCALCSPQ
jgi:hypothetical protein